MIVSELQIFGMLLCLLLAVLAWKMRSFPVMTVSAFGWFILALQIFQKSGDFLIMGLMFMVAFVEVLAVPTKRRG